MEGTPLEPKKEALRLAGLPIARRLIIPFLSGRIERLTKQGITPQLSVFVVGSENENNLLYLRMQTKRAEELGILIRPCLFSTGTPEEEFIAAIRQQNDDSTVHGIIVELPLPKGYNPQRILSHLFSKKDVDSLNCGVVFPRPTPLAVCQLLHGYDIELRDRRIVVVGNGPVVGAPLSAVLREMGFNVSVVDIDTEHRLRNRLFKTADVLISAVGRKGMIRGDDIKPGSVIIDVAGDVDDESVVQVASAYAPYRGGVGPLTCYNLFDNVVTAAEATID